MQRDAYYYGFMKNEKYNVSGFLNNLIPALSDYQEGLLKELLKYNNENANPAPFGAVVRILYHDVKKREDTANGCHGSCLRQSQTPSTLWDGIGVFAWGEDFLALRLVCEHPDLRAGNANPAPFGAVVRILYHDVKKKRRHRKWVSSLFGSGIGIRTPTYRVRVCCATVTQFRYRFSA